MNVKEGTIKMEKKEKRCRRKRKPRKDSCVEMRPRADTTSNKGEAFLITWKIKFAYWAWNIYYNITKELAKVENMDAIHEEQHPPIIDKMHRTTVTALSTVELHLPFRSFLLFTYSSLMTNPATCHLQRLWRGSEAFGTLLLLDRNTSTECLNRCFCSCFSWKPGDRPLVPTPISSSFWPHTNNERKNKIMSFCINPARRNW